MKALAIGLLLLSLQAPASTTPLSSLAGRWVTTVVPPAGEAPMMEPSFTLEVRSGKALLTFEGSQTTEASVLTSQMAADDVAVLIIRYPPSSASTRTVMVRPIAVGQVRVEQDVESADGRPGGRAEASTWLRFLGSPSEPCVTDRV